MANAKGGRPSKLTPEIRKKLLDAIKAGNYYETACSYAGINYMTFRNWMKKGQQAKSGNYFEFFELVTRAESEAEARMVAQWQAQIPQDWRAARDFLARRHPERWAQQEKIDLEHSGEVIQKHEGELSITEKLIADPEFLSRVQQAADERASEDSSRSDARDVD
jgi:transposase